MLFACILNEIGFFEVSRPAIWACFGLAALTYAVVRYITVRRRRIAAPSSKYVMLGAVLLLTGMMSVFLTINVTLLLLLPMLLAARYRSVMLTRIACLGSCLLAILTPVASLLINAWGLTFMTGYLETVCRVSISGFGPPTISRGEAVVNILMYVSAPRLIIMSIFSVIFIAITKSAVRGLNDHLTVMQLDEELSRRLTQVESMQDKILYSIADMVENRDTETGDHVKRTSGLVRILVNEMQRDPALHLTDSFCSNVVKAAPLHDIGKIAVDDAILRKPGPLNEEETRIMRQHPAKSAELIARVLDGLEDEEFLRVAENLAMYHHERYDGNGYPSHLKGDAIPLEARIMAIADVFDALVSQRSYKKAMTLDCAFRILEDSMGSQFDPSLEKYLTAVRDQIEAFYQA